MQNTFRSLFAPPIFPDDDRTRSAAILNTIGWSTITVMVILLAIRVFQGQDTNLVEVNSILIAIIIMIAFILYSSRQGYVNTASLLFVITVWIGLTYLTWVADGIRDVAFFGYFIPITMAGLLLGWQGAIGFTVISIISGWILAYAEATRMFVPTLDHPLNFARDMTGIFILTGLLIYLIIKSLRDALNRSLSTARQLSISNAELNELRVDLEQRVETRTSELAKRAVQLEGVSKVARTSASVQDLNALLPDITNLVSQQFGFYHVGIFLMDEARDLAVLRAANSEGGQQMLNRNHSIPIDLNSIVGYTISIGEPRISLDIGVDSVSPDNPDLPNTHSEMALPLRVGTRVIGAIDVQSTATNAFSPEDVAILTTLADQVSIAIENDRLFGETRNALAESKSVFEKYTRQDWSNFVSQVKHTGFVFDGQYVTPLDNQTKREPIKTAIKTGSLAREKGSATIAVPIKLRGQTIGVLDLRSKRGAR